ncbi:asparagine synthase-related protein, partial [Echinicola sediminis]
PYISKPNIVPFGIPASHLYRLDILDRCYFTIRSDIWNFISKNFGIDYLHPLLDGDLVDFCATIPTRLFKNRPPRSLFKSALYNDLPKDLLEGNKRPLSKVELPTNEQLLQKLREYQTHFSDLNNSFAGEVYPLQNISNELRQLESYLKRSNHTNDQLNASIHYLLKMFNIVAQRSKFLNNCFS